MRFRREYAPIAIVTTILLTSIWLVHRHTAAIRGFIEVHPIVGSVVYFVLNIADALVAPGATLPLIPIVAHAWGRVPAALATTAGWTTGSLLAFLIARRWGTPIVRTLTSLERVRRLRRFIPEDLFWSVVLMRTLLPMDVISYVVGLFTTMSWSRYAAATALGLTPSAFLLVYLGRTPHAYTFLMILVALAGLIAVVITGNRRNVNRRGAGS